LLWADVRLTKVQAPTRVLLPGQPAGPQAKGEAEAVGAGARAGESFCLKSS